MMKKKTTGRAIKERTKRVRLTFGYKGNQRGTVLVARERMNCVCEDGRLRTVFEGKKLLDEDGEQITCALRDIVLLGARKLPYGGGYKDYYYAFTEVGGLYMYSYEVNGFICMFSESEGTVAVDSFESLEGRALLIFRTDEVALFNEGGRFINVYDDTAYPIGCVMKHRVFAATENGGVVYSAPESMGDFELGATDGGCVYFANVGGDIVAMQPFENKLCLFFENGVAKLDVGGDPTDFVLDVLEYDGGKIFGRTVCRCFHSIYFLAENGLYRLRGRRIERLELDIILPFAESGLESCAVYQNRPLIRYMTAKNTYRTLVLGKDDESVFYLDNLQNLGQSDAGYPIYSNDGGAMFALAAHGDVTFENAFRGAGTDFGIAGRKYLRKLRFEGDGYFDVTVKNGTRTRTKRLTFVNGAVEWNTFEYGETFGFDFVLGRDSVIENVTAVLQTLA